MKCHACNTEIFGAPQLNNHLKQANVLWAGIFMYPEVYVVTPTIVVIHVINIYTVVPFPVFKWCA
jgi:hypothetical protein